MTAVTKTRILIERLANGRGVRLRFLSRGDRSDPDATTAAPGERDLTDVREFVEDGAVLSSEALARESLLVSIALGQMQAYVELCARNDLKILIYRDDALSELEGEGETLRTRVTLRPRLAFRGEDTPDARATAIRLLNEAQGQSVFFNAPRITIEMAPVFEFRDADSDAP